MPNLTSTKTVLRQPNVFDYTNIGTAAGTTTICSEPTFLHSVTVTRRVASGVSIIYDSAGTSGTVVGTIALGTQTFSDPPATYVFDVRTKNGLTVTNIADMGLIVSSGK